MNVINKKSLDEAAVAVHLSADDADAHTIAFNAIDAFMKAERVRMYPHYMDYSASNLARRQLLDYFGSLERQEQVDDLVINWGGVIQSNLSVREAVEAMMKKRRNRR